MIKNLKVAYNRYIPAANRDLIIHWITYHLIMLYFIYGDRTSWLGRILLTHDN